MKKAFALLLLAASARGEAHPPSEENQECEVYNEKDLRLAGASPDAGRVEVYHEGEWGTLCGDSSMSLSKVLCRELGFGRAIGVFTIAPKKPTKNWLSGLECTGDEETILDCKHHGWAEGPGCSADAPPIAVRCEAAGLESIKAIPKSELVLDGVDVETVLDPYQPSSESTTTCGSGSPINPFGDNETEAFVYKEIIQNWLTERKERVSEVMCRDSEANPKAIESMLDDGLRWNQYGFDFEDAGAKAEEKNGNSILKTQKADVLREGYLSPNAKVFWSLDHPVRYPDSLPEMEPAAKAIFTNLSRDGFVMIDDFGLDMDALDKTAEWALNQREQKNVTVVLDDGACVMARPEVPALESLITNETINTAIRGYLGQDTVLHGYKILRLSQRLKGADNYIAADWHHDRAGRRLKLFVFLHDIDNDEGRPTEVTNGTHNLVYWSFEDYSTSRFDDEFIQNNFEVHRLGGKRGGGFLFDTNAIHRGSPTGSHKRETIILEYHSESKCPTIHALGLNVPCPSGDQYMVAHKI